MLTHFKAPDSSDATLDPPLLCTKFVRIGTNFPTVSGERPSLSNELAVEARPPSPSGSEPAIDDIGDKVSAAGAALSMLLIPGTAAATLPKSAGLRRLFAKLNSVGAPCS